ncbi:D-beta-D-heptose 7-phosphate kinase/D-beta-D-heptose 1-phosphate adenosyltransferase [Silvibacterium bohemicum]|uniref:Bifunctional protein HldE n=1 Tax=Silvibacterium bohemicum TaxID=1577686 RepID=A0A841K3E3_9BACT|nr:D-glycero-beta-D-manno-heptose-7-phosphate kinase [Silvibacterium bohemicum]MBB6145681.1 D-beta-D-heptose 7-phosphate kinase/D-beta-D-heptose 1-phosphate adenosyltransferase [Silvibacterium bohemicum]
MISKVNNSGVHRSEGRSGIVHLHEIVRLLESGWADKHILVVGDVMLDKYIHGSVDRISPEAPVPIVQATRRSEQPGGAANVAMNVAGLGARATVVGFAGDDEDGSILAAMLKASGVEAHLVTVPGKPTTSKLRILGGSQQMMRLDIETATPRPPEAYTALLEGLISLLPDVDGVILSDYAKGTLTAENCRSIIAAARQAEVPVMVDPKGRDFLRYRGATTISPNLKELALVTGHTVGEVKDVLESGRSLVAELGLEYLTVTLGERGIAILDEEGEFDAPAIARQVFDVSGAGDTVIATMAVATACGVTTEDAARLANVAAGIVVGKLGTVPIARHELVAALTEFSGTETPEKILDLDRLLVRVAEWRASGHTVVFTNGCFDILHVGHIALLEDCRRFGTKVIVGINSDASVSGLKGPSRPIVGERERARILAALAATDAVAIFDAPTPIDLIVALRPDALVKGGDYTEESVVGAHEVKSWGGRVVIVPTVEGFSTTNIVRKLAHSADR